MKSRRFRTPRLAVTPTVFLLLSTLLYFSPYVLSSAEWVQFGRHSYLAEYTPETGVAALLALACVVVGIMAYPRTPVNFAVRTNSQSEAVVLTCFLALLGLYVFFTPQLFEADKADVLEGTNRFHLIFYTLCPVGLISGYLAGWRTHKISMGVSAAGLLLILYIGHRSPLAITILCLIYISYRNQSILSVKRTHILAAVGALIFLALYKSVYVAIKSGNYVTVADRLLPENLLSSALVGLEQFLTFKHLDYIVTTDFELACSNMWLIPVSVIPFTENVLDLAECDYNAQVQPLFFPEFSGGVAANIWAEFYGNFGYVGFPLLVMAIILFCFPLERWISKITSPTLKAGLIVGVIQFTFYIQRKEIFGAFISGKRAVIAALFVFGLAWTWRRLSRRHPERDKTVTLHGAN